MRLASIHTETGLRSAVVVGDLAVPVADLVERLDREPGRRELRTSWNRRLIADPELAEEVSAAAEDLVTAADSVVVSLAGARLGPPIVDPEKIICLGMNYLDHAAEVQAEVPTVPPFFAKFANSLTGPEDVIELPRNSDSVDYEGELAVVIGGRAKNVDSRDAMSFVAGYTVMNDVSCRDLQMAGPQWLPGKIQDDFAPLGPVLVGADEITRPEALRIQTRVGGELVQDGSVGSMISSVADSVAYLSTLLTLEPGDVIATGTPAGVAFGRPEPSYLGPGDVVEVEIEGIGILRNEFRLPRD
jgi:acylpyruvate hydrolase